MNINIQEKDEKKEMVTKITKKFIRLSQEEKSFIAGYMAGKEEEWAKQQKEARKTNGNKKAAKDLPGQMSLQCFASESENNS